MKASAVSTITKSLPIGFPTLVNYSLLATLGYINLFSINYWILIQGYFLKSHKINYYLVNKREF